MLVDNAVDTEMPDPMISVVLENLQEPVLNESWAIVPIGVTPICADDRCAIT